MADYVIEVFEEETKENNTAKVVIVKEIKLNSFHNNDISDILYFQSCRRIQIVTMVFRMCIMVIKFSAAILFVITLTQSQKTIKIFLNNKFLCLKRT